MINGTFRTPYKHPCQNYVFNDAIVRQDDNGEHYFSCSCPLVYAFVYTTLPESAAFERNRVVEVLMNRICDRCPFKQSEEDDYEYDNN